MVVGKLVAFLFIFNAVNFERIVNSCYNYIHQRLTIKALLYSEDNCVIINELEVQVENNRV